MPNKDVGKNAGHKHRPKHREAALTPTSDVRRDKRKYLLSDASAEAVIDACRRGVPETKVAQALGINYRTWMRVREEDERIADVLAEARKIEEDELVGILLGKARGGDLTATIFALKSRHGYRDFGTSGGGIEQRVNVTIHLPAPASSEEEFAKIINVTPAVRAPEVARA